MPDIPGRRVCLAIGIANAKPLDWLPGAATAARETGAWAKCSNFDAVTVLTDEPSIGQTHWSKGDPASRDISPPSGLAVTVTRIREELLRLLPRGELTHWLVLHFAGHGLRQDSVRTLWLPTDWESENRAIAVEALKASLDGYGIENLTLVSDACRDFANRPSTANLTPDAALPKGPIGPNQPALDRLNAVEDGKSAFMVPGATPADARCILSSTLANALWGHEPEAFSRYDEGQVVSDSLLRFVSTKTKAVGERYGLDSKAETIRGYGVGNPDMIYFDAGSPPEPLGRPVDWPPPMGEAHSLGVPSEAAIALATKQLTSIHLPAGAPSIDLTGENFDLKGLPGGVELAFALERQPEEGSSARIRQLHEWQAGATAVSVKQGIERNVRSARRARIRRTLRDGQRRISYQANLIMTGGQPIRVWAPWGARRVNGPKSWSVNLANDAAVQVIIEYEDGLCAPLVVYENLTTLIAHDGQRRITGWMCAAPHAADPTRLAATNTAIAELQTTRLSPGKADEIAISLREGKHADPMLGAIAAYLYDYNGDRDNIRRMAFFYASRNQAIPFDVALLGRLPIEIHGRNNVAFVPAVAGARWRGGHMRAPSFTTRPTEAISGRVAGFCPWLRQGWDYLAASDLVEEPLTLTLRAALPHLLNSTFTAIAKIGAEALIDHFGLEENT